MPETWMRLTLAERLELFDRPGLLPGVSKCLRIEYRGSSARVVNDGGNQKPGASHALIRINDALMLDAMRVHVRVQSVLQDLAFKAPKLSQKTPGKIAGYSHLTLFDWSVWALGRLIFNAEPDVSKAPGYRVLDVDVRIVNPEGGVLDVSWITRPDASAMAALRTRTGLDIRLTGERRASKADVGTADAEDNEEDSPGDSLGGGFALHEYKTLKLDTEIEAGGAIKPLGDWLVEMIDQDIAHLRCEAPFRDSDSEAAFVRIAPDGNVFVHDSGMTTNYHLDPPPQSEEEVAAQAADFAVYEMMMAIIEARTRQRQRQAGTWFTMIGDDTADLPGNDDPPVDLWKAIDAPALPAGLLPGPVEAFVQANARSIGADSAGLAGGSLAVLAAAIPDSVKLQVQTKGKKWLIAARIWIALLGDPSTKKTPIMDAVLAWLKEKDLERRRRHAGLKALWDAQSKRRKLTPWRRGGPRLSRTG